MASLRRLLVSLLLLGSPAVSVAQTDDEWERLKQPARLASFPVEFRQPPPATPDYMVDNTGNKRGVAPIKGQYNGTVWRESGSFEGYMKKLAEKKGAGLLPNSTTGGPPVHTNSSKLQNRQGGSFWLPSLGPLGKAPHAGDGYVFYRNVLDYGADNTGATNTEEAINAAIIDGDRCGEECGNTFVLGALIYFPPGTYKVCTPIIQYYLTQFVGDPHDRPIIKGCDEFTGIALMDVDPYVPNMAQQDGTGVNWYINQNQFFRQIRNFIFDLTEMPLATDEHDQQLVPTGIHWQVSQACSLQNLLFRMPTAGSGGDPPTHVGIFTENGSGGFVSDLEFEGGAIGWRVGSQQYTATSLKFRGCITAVQMVWDWGFNWHKIDIEGGSIAFNISGRGGIDGQGIGSVSIIDSTVSNVPIGILTNDHADAPPNIVIDNSVFNNVGAIVIVEGGETLLEGGSTTIDLWAHGRRYIGGEGERVTGHVSNRPRKPDALLDGSGKLFTRLRPQYEDLPASSFLIATENGCSNDGTGDNTAAINAFLQRAAVAGQVAYFPAGIYSVQGTVTFPSGSKIQGTGWSQIQATGSYFDDMANPQVVVRVGEKGDVGTMEIVDMLFTVKGPTAGAIMMEWNIHESSQGAAALWDSHIRVGGGIGTDLDVATCPKFSNKEVCICVSMLLHITTDASAYLENFWAWVADHDNDMSLYWELDSSKSQIALFGARGVLVESRGPVWIYGSGSEHVIFYQYEMLGAKDVYLGHIQTESPYMQPNPVSPSPMENALGVFPGDPDWADCDGSETCEMAWGLRIIDSEGIMLHSAGLYSWFNDYTQGCLDSENCQQKVMEVRGSKDVSIFNIFSKAVEQIGTGNGEGSSIALEGNQQGYTSEVSFWFPEDSDPGGDVIYISPEVYETHTAQCEAPPCVFVMPPTTLPSATTISINPYTTELEVGASQGGSFVVTTTTVTIIVGQIVTTVVPVSNHNITRGETPGAPFYVTPSVTFSPMGVPVTKPNGVVTTRSVTLPPWPQIMDWPGGGSGGGQNPGPPGSGGVSSRTSRPGGTMGSPGTITFPEADPAEPSAYFFCPPERQFVEVGDYDAIITLSGCTAPTTLFWNCPATATVEIAEPTTVDFSLGCTRWTGTGTSEPVPTMTEYPPGAELEWVEEDGEDDDDDDTSTCELWFFFICINWGRVKIGGWRWNFPGPVVITGPPPIKWPPGVTVKGNLPGPWPPVTIGRDGKPTLPPRQPTNCETQEAEICSTSTFISTTVVDGSTSTITSTATTTCDTIRGCVLPDGDYDTTSRTGGQCAFNPAMRTAAPAVSAVPMDVLFTTATALPSASIKSTASSEENDSSNATARSSPILRKRADEPPPADRDHFLFWMMEPGNEGAVNRVIQYINSYNNPADGTPREFYTPKRVTAEDAWSGSPDNDFDENAQRSDWTPLIFVPNMRFCHVGELLDAHGVEILESYGLYDRNENGPPDSDDERRPSNRALQTARETKRDIFDWDGMGWELSQISVAPGERWDVGWQVGTVGAGMPYFADDSFGVGQLIYILESDILDDHEEFDVSWNGYTGVPVFKLPEFDWGLPSADGPVDLDHGTGVASKAGGWFLGMAKRAQLIIVKDRTGDPADINNKIPPRWMEMWVRVYNDVRRRYAENPNLRGKVVVSISDGWSWHDPKVPPLMVSRWRDIMKMLDGLGVVIVCAAHNDFQEIKNDSPGIPDRFAVPDEGTRLSRNMVMVGGTDAAGRPGSHSPWLPWMVMAPGYMTWVADAQGPESYRCGIIGNSYAAPLVAGIVAYWRSLPDLVNGWDQELRDPSNVKKLLMYMQRPIEMDNLPDDLRDNIDSEIPFPNIPGIDLSNVREAPSIWTGQYGDKNCLQDPSIHPSCPQGRLADLVPHGAGCQQPGSGSGGNKIAARDGAVCVIREGAEGGDEPGSGMGDPITYSPGPASPTCAPGSPGCGTLCTGYYCVPSPSGFPPDRWDPEDPAHRPTSRRPPVTTRPTLPPLPTQTTSCAYPTPTTICNGSGGRQVCITSTACGPPLTLPPLPSRTTSCASYKPTTICNGSGNQHVCETTSVCAETSGAYSGPGCKGYTSTRICNGSGECVEDNICVPSPAPCAGWATIGSALCTDPKYPYCGSTSSFVICSATAAKVRQATPATAEAVATDAPSPLPMANGRHRRHQILEQEREQEREQKQEEVMPQVARGDGPPAPDDDNAGVLQAMVAKAATVLADDVSINNSTGAVAEAALLNARQNNPYGCSGGCAAYPRCNLCYGIIPRVCVQAFITVTMSAIDTDVKLDIIADGELACTTTVRCLTIDNSGCFGNGDMGEMDCGNGNKILAWGNGLSTVIFHSGKTPEQPYHLYLGRDGSDQWYPCDVSRRLIAICIDAMWSAWDGSCKGMSTREAALRKRAEIEAPRDLEFREPLGLGR